MARSARVRNYLAVARTSEHSDPSNEESDVGDAAESSRELWFFFWYPSLVRARCFITDGTLR